MQTHQWNKKLAKLRVQMGAAARIERVSVFYTRVSLEGVLYVGVDRSMAGMRRRGGDEGGWGYAMPACCPPD